MLRRFLLTFVVAALGMGLLEALIVLRLPGSAPAEILKGQVESRTWQVAARAERVQAQALEDLQSWRPEEAADWLTRHPRWCGIVWGAGPAVGRAEGLRLDLPANGRPVALWTAADTLWAGLAPPALVQTWLVGDDGDVLSAWPPTSRRPVSSAEQSPQMVKQGRLMYAVVRGLKLPDWHMTVVTEEGYGGWLLSRSIWSRLQQGLQLLLLSAVLTLAAWLTARQVLHPLVTVREGLHRMVQGDLTTPIHICTGHEMDELAEDINRLAFTVSTQTTQLETAARTQSRFFANVSHELKTPLTAMTGYAHLLQNDIGIEHSDMVGKIIANGDILLGAITDLLDLSRLDAGKLELTVEAVVLQECLERAWSMVVPAMQKQGLAGHLDVPAAPIVVQGSFERLRQVFSNLLTNAVKFTARGTVGLELRAVEGGAEIVVWDTGVGLAEASETRIFEEFVQADASIHGRFGGSGLGLSIARRLVDLHGGRIEVHSIEGQGTRFTVWLPT